MSVTLSEAYIIVVEDDPNAYLITLDLLRMAGAMRCYSRKSVASALTFARKLPRVDLFLVDINMPGQSGYDLLEKVRAQPDFRHVRVVAVTAGTLLEDVQQARRLGFDGFLSKPLKASAFADQIESVLNGERVWDWR